MTFNILMGGEDRFPAIVAIVTKEQPDVLVLQECLGSEDGLRLAAVARAMGIPSDSSHAFLGRARPQPSGHRYNIAMLTRRPFVHAREHNDCDTLTHCLIDATVAEAEGGLCRIIGAHLNACGEAERLAEVRYLEKSVLGERSRVEAVLIAGDLNAVTRQQHLLWHTRRWL
jgi:exodeoxyribonuclease-3